MPSDTTLAACPFCGNAAVVRYATIMGGERATTVQCVACDITGPWFHSRDLAGDERAAVNFWNRRAAPAGLTLATALAALAEVEAQHPYKARDAENRLIHDTCCEYNDGWECACDITRQRLTALAGQPAEANKETPVPNTIVETRFLELAAEAGRLKAERDALVDHWEEWVPSNWCSVVEVAEAQAGRCDRPLPQFIVSSNHLGLARRPGRTVTPEPGPGGTLLADGETICFGPLTLEQRADLEDMQPVQAGHCAMCGQPQPAEVELPDAGGRELVQELADLLAIATDGGCCGLCGCASPDHTPDCLVGQLLAKARAWLASNPAPPVDAGARELVERLRPYALPGAVCDLCGAGIGSDGAGGHQHKPGCEVGALLAEVDDYLAGHPAASIEEQLVELLETAYCHVVSEPDANGLQIAMIQYPVSGWRRLRFLWSITSAGREALAALDAEGETP